MRKLIVIPIISCLLMGVACGGNKDKTDTSASSELASTEPSENFALEFDDEESANSWKDLESPTAFDEGSSFSVEQTEQKVFESSGDSSEPGLTKSSDSTDEPKDDSGVKTATSEQNDNPDVKVSTGVTTAPVESVDEYPKEETTTTSPEETTSSNVIPPKRTEYTGNLQGEPDKIG